MSFTLNPSTLENIEQIREWAGQDIDPAHRIIDPSWWLAAAPGSYLAGSIKDADGVVLYFRFDKEGDLLRMSTQFAPENLVGRRRVAEAISAVLPSYLQMVQAAEITGIVFETQFPELAAFMARLGFIKAEGKNDDYVLRFAPVDCGTF